MNCPQCGLKMEQGFLQTDMNTAISWVSKLLPFGMGYLKSDAVPVSDAIGVGVNAIPAHICKACKMIVADYSARE